MMADVVILSLYFLICLLSIDRPLVACGALVGVVTMTTSALLSELLLPNITEIWSWYGVCFLVSFGMWCAYSWLKLTRSSLVTAALVVFEAFMVVDGKLYPEQVTVMYSIYPYLVTAIHAVIMLTLITERRGSIEHNSNNPHRRGGDKSNHHRMEGGK